MLEITANSDGKTLPNSTKEYREGKAKLVLPFDDNGKPRAFYNPKMSLNRDIAILFTLAFEKSSELRVCDPLTGSGIRAVRYALECPRVVGVLSADIGSATLEVAKHTVDLNGVSQKIRITQSDANLVMLEHMTERFDLIDLDPFGSPSPFFDSALRATNELGIMAATATDMAPLTGARPRACLRKYGISAIRTEFEKEVAVRILAANLAMCAGKLGLGVEIVFSHASDHYARIYAQVRKGKSQSNQMMKLLGFLEYCSACLTRESLSSIDEVQRKCPRCLSPMRVGGPIWLGQLWDGRTVQNMIAQTPKLLSARLSEIQQMLSAISEEVKMPAFYYRTDALSKVLKIKPPAINATLRALHGSGFRASRTHFSRIGFRTNASISELASVFRASPKKRQADKV